MFRQGQLAVHGLAILLGRNEAGISNRGNIFLHRAVRVRYLRERHFGDDGEHDLLALGRVRVLLVLVEPRLQRRRRLARRVLPPRRKVVPAAVSADKKALDA